jgi:branched-subunit amino acid transport protein
LRGGAGGLEREVLVSALWVAIVAVTLASAAIKAAGPILVGGRELPPRVSAVIALLAPALLAALVVTETFGDDSHLVLDERALGVGVAAVALALRAPVLLAVALAALVTALARLFA